MQLQACKGSLTVDRQFRMLQEIKRHCPRSARPLGLEPFWAFLRTAGVSDARQLMESIRQGGGDVKLYLDFLAQVCWSVRPDPGMKLSLPLAPPAEIDAGGEVRASDGD